MFAALSIVGLAAVFYHASISDSLAVLRRFRWEMIAAGCALVAFDWIASGVRIYIFARRVCPEISFSGCVRASLANIFMGGVTPSQTGGGPAQIYVLYKEGMTAVDATVVSFVGSFLCTVLVLPVGGWIVTAMVNPGDFDTGLRVAVNASLGVFAAIALVAAAGIAVPERLKRLVDSGAGAIPPVKRWLDRRGATAAFRDAVDCYRDAMLVFLREGKGVVAVGIALTVAIYFNKFVVAWVVLKGMGADPPFWHVVYTQLVLILFFYFSPSPGAAGLAEVGALAVMRRIVPIGGEGVFVLLWRFFSLYAGMIVGAMAVFRALVARRNTTI